MFYINFRDKIGQNYKTMRIKCISHETLGTKLVNTLNIEDEKCIFPFVNYLVRRWEKANTGVISQLVLVFKRKKNPKQCHLPNFFPKGEKHNSKMQCFSKTCISQMQCFYCRKKQIKWSKKKKTKKS